MYLNKPAVLKISGNLAENFKAFKQEFLIYFKATECKLKSPETQVAILLNLLGVEGLKIYNSLKIKEESVFDILDALEAYCEIQKNELKKLFTFFTRKQAQNEDFNTFYANLSELIKFCNFGKCEDKLLKAQIILGIADKDLQSQLLKEDLPLEKIVYSCQAIKQKTLQVDMQLNNNENKGSSSQGQCDKKDHLQPTQAVFRYVVNNFIKSKKNRLSPSCYVGNFSWKIMVKCTENDSVGLFLQCNADSDDKFWSVNANVVLRLISQKEGTLNIERKFQSLFNPKRISPGYNSIISWKDLFNGYIKDDTVIFEVFICAVCRCT
ncbi:uncharacterized protein LOC126833653 [Adelges cooleyi]|uniref:uncharacterized protein LOC126833653 n=1 Tax=Adelges cooleyi TaxID=133065 RepID=UPI00217FE105|nr:uncharacterized protein LOC126833653 [Adelges cooleyi]